MTTQTRIPVEEILTLACRAPSVQNSQPWLWRLTGDQLDLFADVSRQLAFADPAGRDLLISCGAALHHVQIAAEGLGWRPRVTRMPHREDPHHLATITFVPWPGSSEAYAAMRAISARQTDRRPMMEWSAPPARMTELAEEGRRWGVQVEIADESERRTLADLTFAAHERQQAEQGFRQEESASRVASPLGQGPRPRPSVATEVDQVLIVATASDDSLSRLRAGEALSAIWLLAQQGGLALVPLSQAIEVDETYRVVRDVILDDRACPQILLRVGWLPEGRSQQLPTGRRPLDEVLVRRAVPQLTDATAAPEPTPPPAPRTGPEWRGRPVGT
jgi:hypothetical protein